MAMKKKVVIDGSTVTVGQCKDLFRMINDGTIGYTEMETFLGLPTKPAIGVSAEQLELFFMCIKEGKIDFEEMKDFLEYPKENLMKYPNYVRVINILGNDKVITVQEAYHLWNMLYSLEERHMLDQIRYSEATLRKCAIENKKHQADWYLIYIVGLTLPEQMKTLGTDSKSQPCFNLDWKYKDWFLAKEEKFWADKKPTNGDYYLINLRGDKTNGMNCFEQLAKIGENHRNEVINPHILSESIISLIKSHKMANHYKGYGYRSEMVNSENSNICIEYSYYGLEVISEKWSLRKGNLRTIVYKKHDC